MRNSKAVYSEILEALKLNESLDEKKAIATALVETIFGIPFTRVISDVPVEWSPATEDRVAECIHRMNSGEPLQYVLEEAWFMGRRFFVDRNVLIPRPETEELVREIIQAVGRTQNLKILDIGTGSGCIPITLALELKESKVMATDVSPGALEVAKRNATTLGAHVSFFQHDILNESLSRSDLNVLVSNPPYIPYVEKEDMDVNVLDYEPHLALFVDDADPLKFYRRISTEGRKWLKKGGLIIFECNARFAGDIVQMLRRDGYIESNVIRDLSGKDRIVKAFQP